MNKVHAILAEFANPAELLKAAAGVRDAGYSSFDAHSPFPIHGMDAAMGLKRSKIGFIVGGMAITGATVGMSLQGWASAIEYPLLISGKPMFSWQAFFIVTFALFVLFGAFGAVFGMFHLNRLPQLHHHLFYSERFKKASTDGYFISIEAEDAKFDPMATRTFLESLGGTHVELVEGEE